jgi:hypothetical protein
MDKAAHDLFIQLIHNIDHQPVRPPIVTNSIQRKDFDPRLVVNDALHTHIVIHPRFPDLVTKFLAHKRRHGSASEKALYGSGDRAKVRWDEEVGRLIAKRPYVFMGGNDFTILRNARRLNDGTHEWDRNGTEWEDENEKLTLSDYLR